MNIYKVSRTDVVCYDDYDSFVCYAENKQKASEMHPSEKTTHHKDNRWMGTDNDKKEYEVDNYEWIQFVERGTLKVEFLGSNESIEEAKVIISSYNAG